MRFVMVARSYPLCGFRIVIAAAMLACMTACATPSAPPPTTTPPSSALHTPPPASPSASIAPARIAPTDDFCPPPRGWFAYETKPGDTLRSIADRTASTVELLAMGNCLQNPTRLNSGIILYVPARPVGN